MSGSKARTVADSVTEAVAGSVKETAGIKGQQAKEGAKEAAHETAQKAEGAAEKAQQKTK